MFMPEYWRQREPRRHGDFLVRQVRGVHVYLLSEALFISVGHFNWSFDEWLQARDCDNYTPLHRAAYSGHVDAVRYLLSVGGDPELRTENGWTVIHCAAFWACYDIVAMLLSHGVDVNSKTNGNLTPLHLAINSTEDSEKVFHTVRYLLEAPGSLTLNFVVFLKIKWREGKDILAAVWTFARKRVSIWGFSLERASTKIYFFMIY